MQQVDKSIRRTWMDMAIQYSINNNPYQPDSVFTNLPAGLYTVRIKDAAGCIDSLVIPITQLYPDLSSPIRLPLLLPARALQMVRQLLLFTGGNNPYLFSADGVTFSKQQCV